LRKIKVITILVTGIIFMAAWSTAVEGATEINEKEGKKLSKDEIKEFVEEWADILLHPEKYNESVLPPESEYSKYTDEEKQQLLSALIQHLENETQSKESIFYFGNISNESLKTVYESYLVNALNVLIFNRTELLQYYNETNTTDINISDEEIAKELFGINVGSEEELFEAITGINASNEEELMKLFANNMSEEEMVEKLFGINMSNEEDIWKLFDINASNESNETKVYESYNESKDKYLQEIIEGTVNNFENLKNKKCPS